MISVMKLNSFTGAGYGEKASLVIPTGPVYEEIFLETNLLPEQITRVTITLNGDEIVVLDGQLMKMLEGYKGLSSTQGFYSIPLADITAKTKNGMRYTALVTEKTDNILLEVEIAPAADGAPDVQLKGFASVSPAQAARIVVPQIKKQTMQATSTENEFLDWYRVSCCSCVVCTLSATKSPRWKCLATTSENTIRRPLSTRCAPCAIAVSGSRATFISTQSCAVTTWMS